MQEIKVLDKGFVRLVDHMGDDLSIVRAARVSYNADWRAGEDSGSDVRLVRYMLHNNHTSPFEHVTFTFEIKCPFFIARQWHRHRTWAYNEVSARYTELNEGFYAPSPEHVGGQSKDNKQARDILDKDYAEVTSEVIEQACKDAFSTYRALLNNNCPRELARSVLPLASYTRFFGTVNLHNLFKFIELRSHSGAQWEIQQYAKALEDLICPIVPVAYDAFKIKHYKKEEK